MIKPHADVKEIRKKVLAAHRAGKTWIRVKHWDANGEMAQHEIIPMWLCITPKDVLSTFTNTIVWGGVDMEGGRYELTFHEERPV